MALLGEGAWVIWSPSKDGPTPPWLLVGDVGFSAVTAWCRSASEKARLLLVSIRLGIAEVRLEPADEGAVTWGAATPGIAADVCLSLFWPGNVSWEEQEIFLQVVCKGLRGATGQENKCYFSGGTAVFSNWLNMVVLRVDNSTYFPRQVAGILE